MKKDFSVDTAQGAMVMAIGIFLNGAIHKFTSLDLAFGNIFAGINLLLWILLAAALVWSAIRKTMWSEHFANPIKSFAVGTWIAATSVCFVTVAQRFASIGISQLMFWLNLLLWIFYVSICIRNYKKIFASSLYEKLHGVLLLACVSTQSLVVLYTAVFKNNPVPSFSVWFISIGSILYFIGFFLIMKRYISYKKWNLADNWQNTNCILHGAMSITGLASAISHSIQGNIVFLIWAWVLTWFIIVECIEVVRAVQRINKYGFSKGILQYDVSQWSRNFTFGMLYAFTMNIDLSISTLGNHSFFIVTRHFILTYGCWIVLVVLTCEVILYIKNGLEVGQPKADVIPPKRKNAY
jgi:hypothetical protein